MCTDKDKSIDLPAVAYGKPCYCDIELLGVKTKHADTGSSKSIDQYRISIITIGLLKRAQRVGSDLNKTVTMVTDNKTVQVYDASGNPMELFICIIIGIKVQEARTAQIQLHIQHSSDELVLLRANALYTLGVKGKI